MANHTIVKTKQPYEMTFKQYCEYELERCPYRESYIAKPQLWEWHKQMVLQSQWVNILLERAQESPIPSSVLQSYIRLFGEGDLFRTFRGVYEKGIQNFRIPKKMRTLRNIQG